MKKLLIPTILLLLLAGCGQLGKTDSITTDVDSSDTHKTIKTPPANPVVEPPANLRTEPFQPVGEWTLKYREISGCPSETDEGQVWCYPERIYKFTVTSDKIKDAQDSELKQQGYKEIRIDDLKPTRQVAYDGAPTQPQEGDPKDDIIINYIPNNSHPYNVQVTLLSKNEHEFFTNKCQYNGAGEEKYTHKRMFTGSFIGEDGPDGKTTSIEKKSAHLSVCNDKTGVVGNTFYTIPGLADEVTVEVSITPPAPATQTPSN